MKQVRAFALFWWDFVVGDDHWIALGIVATFAATAALVHAGLVAWWLAPLGVAALLSWSVLRAAPRH